MATQPAPTPAPESTVGPDAAEVAVADVFDFGGAPAGESGLALGQPETPPGEQTPAPSAAPAEPAPAGAETTAAPAAPSGAPPAPVAAPAPAAATPAAPALPAVDEAALRANSLEAQLNAAMARIKQLETTPSAPAAPTGTPAAPGGGTGTGEETPPEYAFTIPEQLGAALTSDDPAQQLHAINHLINGLGVAIHQRVRGELAQRLSDFKTSITAPQQETAQREAAQQVINTYYTKFPAHNNPTLTPMIAAEAAKLQAEFPGCDWSDPYLDALGVRLNKALETLGVGPAPAPAPSGTTPVPPKPAATVGGGPRGTEPVLANDQEAIMLSVFDGPTSPM